MLRIINLIEKFDKIQTLKKNNFNDLQNDLIFFMLHYRIFHGIGNNFFLFPLNLKLVLLNY